MKRKLALLLSLLITASSLCACGDPTQLSDDEKLSADYTRSSSYEDTYNYSDGATSAPQSYNTYSSSITNFELKFFRKYYSQLEDKNESFVLNPASTTLQIATIMNGATGDTKDEISLALGSDLTLDNINQCSSYFKSRLEAVSKLSSGEVDELSGKKQEASDTEYIKFENDLFFNDTSDVKTSFLKTNAEYYGSNIFRFMFSDENALTKINSQFSSFTAKNAISDLDSKNTLISITASDISDKWLESYAESDIEKGTFKSDSGDKEVNFMTSNEYMIKSDKAVGVIKYTSKNPLKLVLVMPNEGTSLEDYVADFTNLEYSTLVDSMDITKKVTAKIPEFSIKSKETAQPLSSALTESGLYSLFTEEATFGNITNSDDLVFNEMYEITPEISVSAAGIGGLGNEDTSATVKERTKELEETDETIEFNRPFIFLLIDNESEIPVYIGTVNNI